MRISDWSSDVCSSDLVLFAPDQRQPPFAVEVAEIARPQPAVDEHRRRIRWPAQIARHDIAAADDDFADAVRRTEAPVVARDGDLDQLGRTSCRGRACQYD